MPDRLHKIVTIFEEVEGVLLIRREYATWTFEGEGSPRDVEITPEQREELYGTVHEASTKTLSEAAIALADMKNSRETWRLEAEGRKAELDTLAEKHKAALEANVTLKAELDALKA